MKALVTIGDSWTVGQGAIPDHVPTHDLTDAELVLTYKKFSYANIIAENYMQDYVVINAADRGIGNRGAIKNLYFEDYKTISSITEGYMIFLLSSWDRFDFIDRNISATTKQDNMRTIRPKNSSDPALELYYKYVHAPNVAIVETMLAIIEAQNFAKMHNLKFCVANAFDNRGLEEFKQFPNLLDQIDVLKFLNLHRPYSSFMVMLERLGRDKYITDCHHPNSEGQKLIAKELFDFLLRTYHPGMIENA